MSGVKLTEGCMITYQDIQKSKKHRYAVFVIREGQIDVETVSWPPLDKFRTPASRTDKGNIMLYFRLVHVTAPSQNSWWTSTRRRERARTADTASMTTSTLSVPTEPSQPSNPNCFSWVGARMALRSRRKCSTPRGNLHLFVSLCNNWSYIYHYYSFDTLKRAFVGVHKVIQANDKSECEQVIMIDIHTFIHNPQT